MEKISLAALVGLCVVLAICGCAAVDDVSESEQRIASMELNQSAGNMTGDDYLIALIYAFIDDTLVLYETHKRGDSFERLKEEASSKFSEYRSIYDDTRFTSKIDNMITMASLRRDAGGAIVSGSSAPVMPEQNRINLLIYEAFHNDSELRVLYPNTGSSIGISDGINNARAAYQTRIVEEAEREEKQKKRASEQLSEQQENEARQIALDSHYKHVYENYSTELADLINQSRLSDAFNRSNEAIGNLVTHTVT